MNNFHTPGFIKVSVKLLLLAIMLLPHILQGQNKPMDKVMISRLKQNVKEVAEKTRTITSDFSQEKEMAMISEKIISGGKFYFRKDKMLRWEYTEPFSYLIIIRNDEITIKDENAVNHFNVSSSRVFLELNRIILGSIQGTLLNDDKNFKASFFDGPAASIAKLYPVSPKLRESLAEIIIYFSHKDFTVDRVDMIEPGGDKTRITFRDKAYNKPVADEKFIVH